VSCDEEIEKLLVAFQPRVDPKAKPLPPKPEEKAWRTQKENHQSENRF
jgi:hypothetical protein